MRQMYFKRGKRWPFMGGRHRQKYKHNKWFVKNRNNSVVFWVTANLILRDLFKIQIDMSPFVKCSSRFSILILKVTLTSTELPCNQSIYVRHDALLDNIITCAEQATVRKIKEKPRRFLTCLSECDRCTSKVAWVDLLWAAVTAKNTSIINGL